MVWIARRRVSGDVGGGQRGARGNRRLPLGKRKSVKDSSVRCQGSSSIAPATIDGPSVPNGTCRTVLACLLRVRAILGTRNLGIVQRFPSGER